MRVTGAGLKKVLLPLLQKRAEEAESMAPKPRKPRPRKKGKKR